MADGATKVERCQPLERRRGRVLELGRDHGARRGQSIERGVVVVRRDEVLVGDRAGRSARVGFEHHGAEPHRPGRDERVPAELPAAQHPDRRRRYDHVVTHGGGQHCSRRLLATFRPVRVEAGGERRIVGGEERHREQRRVRGARLTDCKRRDRDTSRHLHDRVQRVLAGQVT